jgi:hypothetical protein
MKRANGITLAATALVLVSVAGAQAQEQVQKVADGGIKVAGWAAKIDATRENTGLTVADARFAKEGEAFKVTTGPAITYWSAANKATGNYTVKATFTEANYMGLNNHPHPYGIVVAGNDMGTDNQSYLYCAAYGDGRFIVRGFGPAAFQMNARGEPNAAINKATGKGSSVKQEIAVNVHGDKVECAINGTVVGTYNKADLVTAGKLKSLDGMYGLRFGHNTEAVVAGFQMVKH